MRLWSFFRSFGPENVDFRSLTQFKRWPIQIKKYIFSLNLAQIEKLSGIFEDTSNYQVSDIGEE